jgi:hypothetical protein
MNKFSLMDIINTEPSIGDIILSDNKASTTGCINNTCKNFNKITHVEIIAHKEEYYKCIIHKKIEETIENKMFSLLKNPSNVKVYKEPEEYDVQLYELASNIKESDFDSILLKILKKYKYCIFNSYLSNESESSYMFDILTNEYAKFIKTHLKYEISKKDFEEDEYDIYDFMSND